MYFSEFQAEVFDGPAAEAELRQLGLETADIVAAVEAAEITRRSCSPLEPSIAPGFKAWVAAFTALAERKVPQGWEKTETKGLPRLIEPRTAVAITVGSGDEGTGTSGGRPATKSPRGPQSVLYVRSNQSQLQIFEARELRQLPAEAEQVTWWLLIYSDGDDVRAELSLPVGLDDKRRLGFWEKRIIVDIPDLSLPPSGQDEEEPLEVEVNVRPR